jgi:hypothetical protein
MTETLSEISDKIKTLKNACDILNNEYSKTDFHKKKEENPDSTIPPIPEDEEIYKLLTAISQLDYYIKKFQDEQFTLIKNHDSN